MITQIFVNDAYGEKKRSDKMIVWVDDGGKYRIVLRTGTQSNWVAWIEKNVGKIGYDECFISDAYIFGHMGETYWVRKKEEAIKRVEKWMKTQKRFKVKKWININLGGL